MGGPRGRARGEENEEKETDEEEEAKEVEEEEAKEEEEEVFPVLNSRPFEIAFAQLFNLFD